jgi:HAD superfamily hydrolase (TIGR01509 family)
VSVI